MAKVQERSKMMSREYDPNKEKVVEIEMNRLVAFSCDPFLIREDMDMELLKESISQYGILTPLILTPSENGYYRIISGHRRKYCAEQLGLKAVPAIIRFMDEEDQIIAMIDANLHRSRLLYSEKAFAYKMKNDALKEKRRKIAIAESGNKKKKKRSIFILQEETGESYRQISRYIRLANLIPELMRKLDANEMAFNPCVELAYLTPEEQYWVLDAMEYTQATPSLSQAIRIKTLSKEKELNIEKCQLILGEVKTGEVNRVAFKNEQMYQFFPKEYSVDQIKSEILKLLVRTYGKRRKKNV